MTTVTLTIENVGTLTETRGEYTLTVNGMNGDYNWHIERTGKYGWVACNSRSGAPNAVCRPYKTFAGAERAGRKRLAALAGV